MHAEFEHIASLLRVFDDDKKYGDPYFGLAVRWFSKTEIELELQQQKLTPAIYRSIIAACEKMGVERILVRTFPQGSGGEMQTRWIEVTKGKRQWNIYQKFDVAYLLKQSLPRICLLDLK